MKRKNMMTKKISRVIVFYEDGSFEEVKTSSPQPAYIPATPKSWEGPFFYTVTTKDTTSNQYDQKWAYNYQDMSYTPDGAPITNKYAITSSGNGHVEIQG